MPKIKCLIVDDEPLALDILENYISKLDNLELAGRCNDAMEAISFMQRSKIDLLFLDIQMPFLTGINLLKNLKVTPKVIFTTAYREFALDGFDLNVTDYLLKPISFERFIAATEKVFSTSAIALPQIITNNTASADQFIYVKSEKKMIRILTKDILFIEGIKDYIKLKTTEKDIISYQSLSYLEQNLPDSQFLRIHKSYIINLDQINSFTAIEIEIRGHHLPIGRSFKLQTFKKLGIEK